MTSIKYIISCLMTMSTCSQASVLIQDDAEHGRCYGLSSTMPPVSQPPFRSTCLNDGSGNITVVRGAARTGKFGYRLPVTESDADAEQLKLGTSIQPAKMSANSSRLSTAQTVGSTIRYAAYFYVDSGFDDFQPAWHIQMQWKGYDAGREGSDRYWPGQNPKIAWGFRRLGNTAAEASPLQVVATVRDAYPNSCSSFSYDLLTRESTMGLATIPVPRRAWVKITTEIYFHTSEGAIRIWQESAGDNQLIIDARDINTASQLVPEEIAKSSDTPCSTETNRYSYTNPTHFSFGIANYLSGRSFTDANRETNSPHILFIDDIVVESIDRELNAPPSPPLLSRPRRP